MEHAAEQPCQRGGFHHGGVVVAALHHRQRRFTDREHIARLQHGAGVVAQHLGWIVEGAQQMGADRQHGAVVSLAPLGAGRAGGCWPAQGDQHAVAALQAAEGSVVHPEDLKPESVQQLSEVGALGGTDGDAGLGLGGLVPLDDVSEPVAVGAGLFIRMLRPDLAADLQPAQLTAAQQGWAQADLRHEHLHAPVRVGDREGALDQQLLVVLAQHLPVGGAELQR